MSHFKEFKSEVHAYLREQEGTLNANTSMWVKFAVYSIGVVTAYLLVLSGLFSGVAQVALLTVLAFLVMGFMVNLLHDMIHGGFSQNPFFKNTFCYSLDLIGPSSLVWKNKHNNSHHTYTNNALVDNDLNVSAILRFTPSHKRYSFNRYQHLYILPAYALHTPFWFFITDFKNIIRKRVTKHKLIGFTTKEKVLFFVNKALHLLFAIGIPAYFFGLSSALLGYAYVYALIGISLALIFQVAHVYEGSRFHSVEKFETIDHWARVQIESSTVFAPGSRVAFWCYGGLNYQVIHHLFPEVCHIHYDRIYPLVQEYCRKNEIQFVEFPSFASAIRSHLRQVYLLGRHDLTEHSA